MKYRKYDEDLKKDIELEYDINEDDSIFSELFKQGKLSKDDLKLQEPNQNIIDDNNYQDYIFFPQTNNLGLGIKKYFQMYKNFLFKKNIYIESSIELNIVENGYIYIKRHKTPVPYTLAKMDIYPYYTIFLERHVKLNSSLGYWFVIKSNKNKDIFILQPQTEKESDAIKILIGNSRGFFFGLVIVIILLILAGILNVI